MMAKSPASFTVNDRINHSVHGLGTISERSEQYTVIDFDESGTRKFVTSMVKLSRSDTLAPDKPVRRKKKATSAKTTKAKAKAKAKTTKSKKAE